MSDELAGWAKSPEGETKPPERSPAELVSRALKAALAGYLVFPVALHVWSLWMLSSVTYSVLEPSARRKYWFALCIDVLALLAIGAFSYLAMTGRIAL